MQFPRFAFYIKIVRLLFPSPDTLPAIPPSRPTKYGEGVVFLRYFRLSFSTHPLYNVVNIYLSGGNHKIMKIKITTRRCTDEVGRPHIFHYFLLAQPVDTGGLCCENYGICIEDDQNHTVSIPSITTSATRIDQLMTLLVEHLVGPAGLEDVIADWL